MEGLEGEAAGWLVAWSVTGALVLLSPHPAIPCTHGSPSWIKVGFLHQILTLHSAKAGRKCIEHRSKTKMRNPTFFAKEETFIKLYSLGKF